MTGGPVITEKEIREVMERMEHAAVCRESRNLLGNAAAYRDCCDMLQDLLTEHGL